ncbi:MAG: hypothetical protein ACYS0I_04035 [Planctomycetota bacterium]|jgi:hypothetical protein
MKRKKYLILVILVFCFAAFLSLKVSGISRSEKMQLDTFGISTLDSMDGVKPIVRLTVVEKDEEGKEETTNKTGTLSESELRKRVEFVLRTAGIKVATERTINNGTLMVGVVAVKAYKDLPLYIFTVQTELIQSVALVRDAKIRTAARTWPNLTSTQLITVGPDELEAAIKRAVASQIDKFVEDYTAANSK